jgi:diguanylate cyclase (GGDEF)-like protein
MVDRFRSGPAPGPAETPRSRLLHLSDRSRVSRVPHPRGVGSAVRKEVFGPDAAGRLRNEVAVLQRLASVNGVPRLIDVEEGAHAFLMEDCNGRPLADLASSGPVDVAVLVPLAQALTDVLAAVHRNGIVHKDINPTNVLLADGRPLVIDFAFAQAFTEEHPEPTHHSMVIGTLTYLAPEQTGRMGHPVDHRADLYSLGATLYELAVGVPPFGLDITDQLALIHAHLAQRPTEPIHLDPSVPPELSAIIMRLLEKEPDGRYQSAEGLSYDLARLSARLGDPQAPAECFRPGTRDFPHRLAAPTQLVGRETEAAALRDAFSGMCRGGPRGVFIAGAPGVGKTALLDELRPLAASAGGWFVSTKLDPHRQEHEADPVVQGLGQLCRLLLAEPEEHLAAVRDRAVAALGPNAGLLAHSIPELANLLSVTPEPPQGDPGRARTRIHRATVALLEAVASPSRPLVFVVDDLQWAPEFSIGVLDAILSERELSGVLLAGAYRAGEVDMAHPLAAALAAWERRGEVAAQIRLQNLQPDDLAVLLGRMLRLDPVDATPLAQAIGDRTGGNPFDTVELVNALRQEGVLVCGPDGWHWDPVAIRRFVSLNDVVDLLQTRIKRLPALSRRLVRVLMCLGGQVHLDLLAEAAQLDPISAAEGLDPAVEDGLVVVQRAGLRSGRAAEVRFRHDRVREALESLEEPASCTRVHLQVARLLAPVAAHAGVAAEQYLFAAGEVEDPTECRLVAELFLRAAQANRLVNGRAAIGFLSAARNIVNRADAGDADPLAGQIRRAHHAVLCSLARHDEADEFFAEIERCCSDDLELADSVCLQIGSLTGRSRSPEAVALGLDMLRRLGFDVPDRENLIPRPGRPTEDLRSWLTEAGRPDDARRAELADPVLGAAAKVIDELMAPAYFSDLEIMAWLVMQAAIMWSRHGPCAALVGSITHAAFIPLDGPAERQTVYDVIRHVLSVSEARGYEPATSLARWRYSVLLPWYQQVEDAVHELKLAREGLIRGGDLQHACFTFAATTQSLLDCATDLEALNSVISTGIAFSTRTGNRVASSYLGAYRQFAQAMCAETCEPDSSSSDSFDLTRHLAQLTDDPITTGQVLLLRALEAALLDDPAELDEASTAAIDALQFDPATYGNALARLLRALSLADRLRTGRDDGPRLLEEFDRCHDWLSARCSEAPANFAHVLELVGAERAWAVGDHWAALQAFESALREVSRRPRPLYQALIMERAALCYLWVGLERAGLSLMAQARQLYARWGATAKVRQLEGRFPGLPAERSRWPQSRGSSSHELAAEAIDLLAIVKTSQALSTETNLPRLQSRVAEVLIAMTGATGVQIALRAEDTTDWLVTVATVEDGTYQDPASSNTLIPWDEASRRGLLALSVFRYLERTRAVFVVDDVQTDERFTHDPYFAARPHGSLLAVPVVNQDMLRAMLILENRLSRGAFTSERLDAVQLIVGQLAVSLDNALLYRSLETKIAARTRDLETAKHQLEILSLTDPLTHIANRRHFQQHLALQWADLARSQRPLAVVMVDIDHFKQFNDALGHLAGDDCIRQVATALSEVTREHDLVARYGGEEFAVILPGAGAATASQVAERLRAAVAALAIDHPTDGTVSISLGVATAVPRSDLRAENLVNAADAALYRAKQNGRNRIETND